MERDLAQPRHGLVLPQGGDRTDLVDFLGKASPSLRSGWGRVEGGEGRGGGKRGGREKWDWYVKKN